MLDSLELAKNAVLDQCETGAGPGFKVLQRVANHFEITLDDLIDNRIDGEWIRDPRLASHFIAEEGSRMRTSLAVIRWIEKHYGAQPTASLMRELRIPRKSAEDPDRPVRLRLLGSLLRAARARGLREANIFEMGVGAVDIPENATFRSALAENRTPRQLYERFFAEFIGRFESNYDYRIEKCENRSITLRIRPREERIAENGIEVASDRSIAVYRWGVAAGLLKTIGQGSASVTPLHYIGPESKDEMIRLEWGPSSRSVLSFPARRPSSQTAHAT